MYYNNHPDMDTLREMHSVVFGTAYRLCGGSGGAKVQEDLARKSVETEKLREDLARKSATLLHLSVAFPSFISSISFSRARFF